MNQGEISRRLNRVGRTRANAEKALLAAEEAERDFEQEAEAAHHRKVKTEREEAKQSRKARNHELFRLGGIVAMAGLSGLDEETLLGAFQTIKDGFDRGDQPRLAVAALVKHAGLDGESPEVLLGILLRGKEVLNEPPRREELGRKGRQRLEDLRRLQEQRSGQMPVKADPVDRRPMMVRFKAPGSPDLRKTLKELGMKYYSEEKAWRGPNELATKVRAAIKAAGESEKVAYPADWRDD